MANQEDTIFLLAEQGKLQRIPRTAYDSEDLLQSLLDDYPDLLAGEQINPEEPVRWLIIKRARKKKSCVPFLPSTTFPFYAEQDCSGCGGHGRPQDCAL